MAGAMPHFAPHEAFAPARAASESTAGTDTKADAETIVFRLLLPRSFGDADAMDLYAAIAPLRRRTAALDVRVDALGDYPDDADANRVAVIIGPISPTRRVEVSSSSDAPLELSPAQEALVSVVDSGGVLHYALGRGPECVTCIVLVEAERLKAALGREILEGIAREAGAEIHVASWSDDEAPSEQPPEEVVEITGDRTAVRKSIIGLSSCLQGDLQAGSSTTFGTTSSPLPPRPSLEVPESNLVTSSECANSIIPYIDCPPGFNHTKDLQQISFRLLCHVNLAGGLIGTKGSTVKGFEEDTGASIDVSNPLTGCKERVITISALEGPVQQYSKVQSALLHIFDRMEELERRDSHSMFNKPSQCSARVLVLKNHFSSLVGFGGAIINEMVKSTRAEFEILGETDIPACASCYERVLQITGDPVNVRDALSLVCEKLRNLAFSSQSTKYNDGHATSSDIVESSASSQVNTSSVAHYSTDCFPGFDHGLSLNGMDSVENSKSAFQLGSPASSEHEKPANGNDDGTTNSRNDAHKPASRSGLGIDSSSCVVQKTTLGDGDGIKNSNQGSRSLEENKLASHRGSNQATVLRTTYDIAVCGSILCLLHEDNGNILAQLREISGADITIYDPPAETSESIIVISGTPQKAQLALAGLIDLTYCSDHHQILERER